jgi:ornithine racemase
MNRLIVNLAQVTANTRRAKQLADDAGYSLVAVLKAVHCHPQLISAIKGAGANSFAFSSIESVAALAPAQMPDRVDRLLLGPSAPGSAEQAVALFGNSIQSTHEAISAFGAAAHAQRLRHGIYIALRTDDDREGLDLNDKNAIELLASAIIANGLCFEGLACNLGCTQLDPMGQGYLSKLKALRTRLSERLGQPVALSLGGSFILPDLPMLSGDRSVRVGELLLAGTEPAARQLADCATAFTLEACIVEVTDKRVLVDMGTAALEAGSFTIGLPNAHVMSMSGEFMVIEADFVTPPCVGDNVQFGLGYGSLKRALSFPFLVWEWV